jgi:hypothetical protein
MSAERLAEFSKRVAKEKRRLSILLLGPGQPSQAKRVYRDEVRADLRRSYKTEMMEDFRMNIPLDDKFSKLISGRNLIAAVFVRRGSREGLCWELGFLEGFARGKDQETGKSVGLFLLQRCVVAWVQEGAVREITRMVTEGIFTKIEVRPFKTQHDLIADLRFVCNRKLYGDYRKDLWP